MMGNKEKNFASAVIYVHNAEDRVETFLKVLINVMEENFEHSEIICVNDASDDESLLRVRETSRMASSTSISVVNMSYFHGLEAAMDAGVDLAIGDFVFEFDNMILDFDKAEIMNIYQKSLGGGYDIVSASANRKERFTSGVFYVIFGKYADHLSYKMGTESFRVLSRRVINRISSMNKTVPYRKAVYANCGLKMQTVKYDPAEPEMKNPMDKKERQYRMRLAVDSLLLFTGVGYRFSVSMTFLMMFMSVFMVFYSAAVYVTSHPVEGWTTTILFLSVAFLGLFGVLTVIIKYLQLLVNLVFKRKHYTFENIEKLTR